MDTKQNEVETGGLEDASSEEIRDDIRGTRRGMDSTLNEIGERLHPRHLLDDLFDVFRGGGSSNKLASTSKDIGRTISHELREHPLPALLVGAGIAWWIYDMASDDDSNSYGERRNREMPGRPTRSSSLAEREDWEYRQYDVQNRGRQGDESVYRAETDDGTEDRTMVEKAGDKVKDAASAVSDTVSDAASAVGEKVRRGGSAVGSAAGTGLRDSSYAMQDYAARGKRAVREQAGIVQERFREASDEYPLALGGAFLAAGLLAGLLLPSSEREDQWMGEASDQVKDEARAKGEEALEKGKTAAAETAASALDEAEARGITPDSMVEKAGDAVSETVKSAQKKSNRAGGKTATEKS